MSMCIYKINYNHIMEHVYITGMELWKFRTITYTTNTINKTIKNGKLWISESYLKEFDMYSVTTSLMW